MPGEKKRTELYVGLFVFTGCLLLGGLVLQFGRFGERIKGHYFLTVVFDDASGVIKGSEVRMGGAKIGKVSSLPVLNDAVRVEVELSIVSSIKIPKGAKFQISSATLLGDKLIVIDPPADRTSGFIDADSRLEGAGLTGFDAIQDNAENLTEDVLRITRQAEQSITKVDAAVVDIRAASAEIKAAAGKINGSMLSEQNLKNFDSTLASFSSAAEKWNATSAKFEPTVDEAREAIASIKKTAANLDHTLQNADNAIAEIKPALQKFPKAIDELAATTRKAGDVLDGIKKGQGMLGAMAVDNDIALDLKTFMHNLKDYGILRYKNRPPTTDAPEAEEKPKPRFGTRNR